MLKSLKMRSLATAGVLVGSMVPVLSAGAPASAATQTVNVVGYSIVAAPFTELETAFQQTTAGHGVVFKNSFGASTTQAQSVLAGQSADIVNFSAQPDLQLLVNAKLVASNWNTNPVALAEGGMVTDSVVSIVVRPGNPLKIHGWNDLIKPGVKIVTPDPVSSGSARWNLLAAYESQLQQGFSATAAKAFTDKLVGHVISEPSSGSKALTAFLAGTGNVLLAYESDASAALAAGKPVAIVNPAQNLKIENPAAITVSGSHNTAAVNFYKYLFSTVGQSIWESQRFRATLPALAAQVKRDFYTPAKLITIKQLGGWPAVTTKFFSPTGIITKIEAAHGYTS